MEMNAQSPPYPYPPTSPGQPQGYGQPPAEYPPQPGYASPQYHAAPPSQPQQQQQQSVVVVNASQAPVVVQNVESFAGHIAFACVVAWCCNCLFGLIAFILAMVASSTAVSDPAGARKLGHASLGMSTAGIIVTVLVVAIAVGVTVASAPRTSSTYYSYTSCPSYYYKIGGVCYISRTHVGYPSYASCSGVKSGSYCYYGVYSY